jgi:hypothetical protein
MRHNPAGFMKMLAQQIDATPYLSRNFELYSEFQRQVTT